jgi:hypothetical protein
MSVTWSVMSGPTAVLVQCMDSSGTGWVLTEFASSSRNVIGFLANRLLIDKTLTTTALGSRLEKWENSAHSRWLGTYGPIPK